MASARKKQDELNLKTLRELVSRPHNKYCFDCNQRGPTYVNVTIGSFVCTKCSGMLRGLTPPHRVKSISMAAFTAEEIDLVQRRGNEYCRRTWLGLYEGQPLGEGAPRDEQRVHDLMVEKYERRRYYVEPSTAAAFAAVARSAPQHQQQQQNGVVVVGEAALGQSQPKPIAARFSTSRTAEKMVAEKNERNGARLNGISRPVVNGVHNNNGVGALILGKQQEFVANFDQADIFNATNNNANVKTANSCQLENQQQMSFANFDDNPVFSTSSTKDAFSIFDLQFCSSNGPMLNHVPLFPKCNVNRWSKSGTLELSIPPRPQQQQQQQQQQFHQQQQQQKNNSSLAPPEDRYLPLKDLDNALRNQPTTIDWNSSGSSSNGTSGYGSSTPSGSVYGSSSPQSMYGSPSQSQFPAIFPQESTAPISNPFNTNNGHVWSSSNGFSTANGGTTANPFKPMADPFKTNGFNPSFQPMFAAQFNGQNWTPNPFKVATNGHSNNPFL